MNHETTVTYKVELESIWATPKPGMTIDELHTKLINLGHIVYEIDPILNRIRIK